MDWISMIIGAVIGGFISWLITKIYYEKSKKDNEKTIADLKQCIEENGVSFEIID